MKRITFLSIVLAALVLPSLVSAQILPPPNLDDRTGGSTGNPVVNSFNPRTIERYYPEGGSVSSFGGVPYYPFRTNSFPNNPVSDIGVDLEVQPAPILACSGLDIRDTIQAMFDMESLGEDLKNYLKSYLAKEALSLVYSSPAIAGVLDGLKAFGNARFQLAQTSCEAIEAEVSSQSRQLRQMAFQECLKQTNNDVYKCSVETGNYAEYLNEVVNNAENRINSSLHNWTSRLNLGGNTFLQNACSNLGEYCDADIADKASQINAGLPNADCDIRTGKCSTNPPAMNSSKAFESALVDATDATQGTGLVYRKIAQVYGGDLNAANRDLNIVANRREAAYRRAGRGGGVNAEAVSSVYNRQNGANIFISSERMQVASTVRQWQREWEGRGVNFWQHPDIGNGEVGRHSANSLHYYGLAIDVYGDPRALAEFRRYVSANRDRYGVTEIFGPGDPGHDRHVHVGFFENNMEARGAMYDIRNRVAPITRKVEAIASIPATPPTGGGAQGAVSERVAALETALKDVPLVAGDACFWDLDGKPETLEDIRDIDLVFALNTRINQAINSGAARGEGDAEPNAAQVLTNTLGQVESLQKTLGRIALCLQVTQVDRMNMLKTFYLSSSEAFGYEQSLALAIAGQSALNLYDALIYQLNLARLSAVSNPDAPAAISTAFEAASESLTNMRDALRSTVERQQSLAARQSSIDRFLANRERTNRAQEAQQGVRNASGIIQGIRE